MTEALRLQNLIFNRFIRFSGSLFHVYSYGRDAERNNYPNRRRATAVDQPIGLAQLYQIRSDNDRKDKNAFKYGIVGVDTTCNAWNNFGIYEGLMTHPWRDELERLMMLSRGDGNKLLAEKATRQARERMAARFE